MASPPPSDLGTAAVFLGLIVLILVRRTYASIRGTRYSVGRLVGFTGFYVFLFATLAFTTLYGALGAWGARGWLLLAPYVGVVLGTTGVAARYVRRIVHFERRDGGPWYYRLPWLIPALYLALFVIRFGVELGISGLSAVTSFLLPTSISTGLLLLLVGLDLLFGVSVGLLIGRAVGVYVAFRDLPTSSEPPPAPPLARGEPP